MFDWKPRRRQRPTSACRTSLRVETLEERAVPASFNAAAAGLDQGPPAGPAVTTVYVESNNPNAGQNAVLAFRRMENVHDAARTQTADSRERRRSSRACLDPSSRQRSTQGTGSKLLAAPRKDGLTQRLADVDNRRIECACLIAAGVVLKKKIHAMPRKLMPAPFHFRKRHRWAEIDVQLKVNVHIDAS